MTEKIITTAFKVNAVDQIVESVTEPANTLYYLFVGNHIPFDQGDTLIPTPNTSFESSVFNPYVNMMFGKQITSSDMLPMIKRNNWTANTVYTMYDHEDGELFNKEFYVVTNQASQYHIFKCLYNAGNTESTVQPSYADVAQEANLYSNSDTYYQTSDGYQWKYMYSMTDTNFNKFATDNYMPLEVDINIVDLATDGSIDVINVQPNGGGRQFNNYLSNTFVSTDLRVSGNTVLYKIPAPSEAGDGYYANCILHITSGPATGQYKKIVGFTATNDLIILESEFSKDNRPETTSTYEISPEVVVIGDGQETTNCIARALIDANTSNSVYQVEILTRGSNYRSARATIMPATGVGNTTSLDLKPIISPPGGHGADPKSELGASYLGISVTFANTEGGLISPENDFRQVGIIRDPLFANVEIEFVKGSDDTKIGSDGVFSSGEKFQQFKKVRVYGTASVNTTSAVITKENDADWSEGFETNQWIYLRSSTKLNSFISQVVSTDANTITLSSNVSFEGTSVEVFVANVIAEGYINDLTTGQFYSQNTSGFLITGELIIGETSYAVANISNVAINSVSRNNGFDVFNQMSYFTGSATGAFNEDEEIYQDVFDVPVGGGFTARIHSIDNSGATDKLYFTRKDRNILTTITFANGVTQIIPKEIVGQDSGSTFTITDEFAGDIVPNSGEIIYIQNGQSVSRSNTTSETIKIIAEF